MFGKQIARPILIMFQLFQHVLKPSKRTTAHREEKRQLLNSALHCSGEACTRQRRVLIWLLDVGVIIWHGYCHCCEDFSNVVVGILTTLHYKCNKKLNYRRDSARLLSRNTHGKLVLSLDSPWISQADMVVPECVKDNESQWKSMEN